MSLFSRRELLRAAPALALASLAPRVFAQARGAQVSFLALGDWGRGGRHRQRDVADRMALEAERIRSRFVATVGDNFYFFGVSSVRDEHWRRSFENVYRQSSLQTPWFPALGNHDHAGNADAQIAYSQVSRRWRMPARFYAVRGEEQGLGDLVDLFILDTQPIVHGKAGAQDQLAWLQRTLVASRARWKLVLGHHPIRSYGPHGGAPALAARLGPILKAHGAHAYVCGHDHSLQHLRDEALDLIVTGAGSAVTAVRGAPADAFALSRSGFTSFTLDREAARVRFIDYRGECLHQAELGAAGMFGAACAA